MPSRRWRHRSISGRRSRPRSSHRTLRGGTSLWQSGFGISIAARVYIGIVLASRTSLMATLAGTSGQPNVVATVTGNNLLVVPASLLTDDPRAIELWLILPGPDQRPHSLGLIEPGQAMRLEVPPDLTARLTPLRRRSRSRSSRLADRPLDNPPDR
jgi:anti-sigma-K factor RskA